MFITLNFVLTSFSHFLASSRALLNALVLKLLLRTLLLLLLDFDLLVRLDFERDFFFFLVAPKEVPLISLKPFVYLKMLRLTLVIFLRDLDRPRPLPPDAADLPDCLDARDLADLDAERPLFTDLLFDLFFLSFLEALLLRLRPSFLSFLLELLLLALFGVDFLADRLLDFFFEPLFGLL